MSPLVDWPSLFVSCVVHLTLATLVVAALRGCVTPPRTDAAGATSDWLDARIVVADVVTPTAVVAVDPPAEDTAAAKGEVDDQTDDTAATGEAVATVTNDATGLPADPPATTDASASGNFLARLDLSDEIASRREADQRATAAAAARRSTPRRTSRVAMPARRSTDKPAAEAGLFGIADRGRRIVYVIDRSESMIQDRAMQAAKRELTRSIDRLLPDQQFQVIFYNVEPLDLVPGDGSERSGLFRGVETDRQRVATQFAAILPDGGTRHRPAIERALSLEPDVMFFLTDGDRPGLSLAELDDITRRNAGRCRIHCIHFGRGGAVPGYESFLHRLAARNGGRYVYHDTTAMADVR